MIRSALGEQSRVAARFLRPSLGQVASAYSRRFRTSTPRRQGKKGRKNAAFNTGHHGGDRDGWKAQTNRLPSSGVGSIEIDRKRLEAASCQCYELMSHRLNGIVSQHGNKTSHRHTMSPRADGLG